MKKKYYFIFKWPIYVLAVLINALLITVLVLNALKLGSVGDFRTTNMALDVSALLMSILLMVLADSTIFFSSYTLKDIVLTYSIGLMRYNISYDDIITIREDKDSHAMVLNYKRYAKAENGDTITSPSGIVINISNNKKEQFVKDIREKNKRILYELIDKNQER